MKIRKILVPVDGSSHSLRALEVAKGLSSIFESEIVLMHVIDPCNISETPRGILYYDEKEVIENKKIKILDKADDHVGSIASDKYCVIGNPAEEILKKLEEDDIDLIVIAKKGVSGIERYIIGSVSSKVVEHSPKSVYLIK